MSAQVSDLRSVWSLNRPGSTTPHSVVVLPSFSVGEEAVAHYAARLAALEHRYLVTTLVLDNVPGCHLVFVTCEEPSAALVDYYVDLLPAQARDSARERFRVVTVPDHSPRPVGRKLLDDPAALEAVRSAVAGRPALVEPWNVTATEVEVAARLGLPLNGTSPEVWPVAFKSAGRRLLAEAGVPVPLGREDLREDHEVVQAAGWVRDQRPQAPAVVVKLDNSVAGDGNLLLPVRDAAGRPLPDDRLAAAWDASPDWFRATFRGGGVVEEFLAGGVVASPSGQATITPDGEVQLLATHEQILGGDNGQVYLGCRFPASSAYAETLRDHLQAIGAALAEAGALGAFGVDFMAVQRAEGWQVFALEINLRRGGTTHPFAVLRNLVPGRYDAAAGAWIAGDGTPRVYCSTDNLQDPRWMGLSDAEVIARVRSAGLHFDPERRTGVVLHMLTGLHIDGRIGYTAIGRDDQEAAALAAAVPVAIGTAR